MGSALDYSGEFADLVDTGRSREALLLFYQRTQGKRFADLSPVDLEALDCLCRQLLPDLIERHTLWLVNHPGRLRHLLGLLTDALAADYQPAATTEKITWLRCLLAVGEAMARAPEQVHQELRPAGAEGKPQAPPPLNGAFRKETEHLKLSEGAHTAFLRPFFTAYVEFLRRAGHQEWANELDGRIGRLLGLIARDERRPGVVRALFYGPAKTGEGRFLHVSIERRSSDERQEARLEPDIVYARASENGIDPVMQEAATWVLSAADGYLRRAGYADGLDQRLVRWEISTLRGDPADLPRKYRGGSVALPLSVAIVSTYLTKPVPNDVAFTGALSAVDSSAGSIRAVDNVPEKVRHAVLSGCKVVYLPRANFAEVDRLPALRNLASEHDARLVPVESLDEVCDELFPPEGSGRLKDILKDVATNFVGMFRPSKQTETVASQATPHLRHRAHILFCGALTALLVFVEGWMAYKVFAPGYSPFWAWTRILAAAFLALAGMCVGFALPAACLRHRKAWSWYASIAVLTVCLSCGALLVILMLPETSTISRTYTSVPPIGVAKDIFVIWLFAWAIAVNTFNAVASLEHLVNTRQFVTARACLRWGAMLENRMPVRCVHFPWNWGALGLGLVAALLIAWELDYYGSLRPEMPETFWHIFLGLGRDLLFIVAIAEVMLFYKAAVARVRNTLS